VRSLPIPIRRVGQRAVKVINEKVAIVLGAGFSKPWGLPLTAELMGFHKVGVHPFPGVWQQKTIRQIESLWVERSTEHLGSVDQFGRLLRGTELFDPFVRYVGLQLSPHLWSVGGARETKWGTGDHVARVRRVPPAYRDLFQVLRDTELVGIVTTNYDVEIEKLLGPRSSGRLGGFNYGQAGELLVGRHYTSSRGAYGPVELTGRVPLAKVHGSLSWAFPPDGGLIRYVDCRPSRGQRYSVAVFPPGGADTASFRPVFGLARRILSAATIWLVIGYSFPDADDDVRQLVRDSASRLALVCVVDPRSSEVVRRIENTLSSKNQCRFHALPGLGSAELPTRLLVALTEYAEHRLTRRQTM
jgi:SIR2-like domain